MQCLPSGFLRIVVCDYIGTPSTAHWPHHHGMHCMNGKQEAWGCRCQAMIKLQRSNGSSAVARRVEIEASGASGSCEMGASRLCGANGFGLIPSGLLLTVGLRYAAAEPAQIQGFGQKGRMQVQTFLGARKTSQQMQCCIEGRCQQASLHLANGCGV